MAKGAREKRRQAQRSRRAAGPAAEVADRADRGIGTLVDAIGRIAALRGKRVSHVDLEGFASLRESFIGRGYRWPDWCFLPVPIVGAALGEELAIDMNPSLVSPATMLAALAAAWTPGRIAVRFDDDVARALMNTPLEGTIPTEVLQRLPAWGLYIDCPGFGAGSGFFVTLDAGTLIAPGDQGCAEVTSSCWPSYETATLASRWSLALSGYGQGPQSATPSPSRPSRRIASVRTSWRQPRMSGLQL